MLVLCERRGCLLAKVIRDTANRKVHLAKPPRVRVAFLANYGNSCRVALVLLDELMRLHKHAHNRGRKLRLHRAR